MPTSDETALDRGHILAIVRFHEPAELDPILAALMAGGVEMLEVTLDTPGALDAVRRAAEAGTFIGAGTVLTSDDVRLAADAGARFVVRSPEGSLIPSPGMSIWLLEIVWLVPNE